MHNFQGKWITTEEFCHLAPRNVFSRQLARVKLDCTEHRDRHILFRRRFVCDTRPREGKLYISADDHYKLYVNGTYVCEGPAPAYHFQTNYNVIDVSDHLKKGENVIAVHTLYQGLINRVWQSGDGRHGLILDLVLDGETVLASDERFLCAIHTAYRETGVVGYETGFLEEYDARAATVGFERPDYDDGAWASASLLATDDHVLVPQATELLLTERIDPVFLRREGNTLFLDFGRQYVGTLALAVEGRAGDTVILREGQELTKEGRVRYALRACCTYEETFLLSDGVSVLDAYDYKAFRYAELTLPEGCEVTDVYLSARHYPFALSAHLRPEYAQDETLRRIWELCVHTQRYGVQEAVLDCMEREKGFYLGDGCYTALTHTVLTGNDAMVRKLIDDAFSSAFITDGLVTCMNCSFMQEIAEYPLMLVKLVLWHYRYTGDLAYLAGNYPRVLSLLERYRRDYEREGLLYDLDKWCVVEWPENFRDGYAVDILEGKVCHEPHVAIGAYYIEAVRAANAMAEVLGEPPYRDEAPLLSAFYAAFYDKERHLYHDGLYSDHVSMIGNIFPFAFGLCPDGAYTENVLAMIRERGIRSVSLFGAFPLMEGLVRVGREDLLRDVLLDAGAWRRMLDEGATATLEGWGHDTKWNTSLFHLTMSYAALFLSDCERDALLAPFDAK